MVFIPYLKSKIKLETIEKNRHNIIRKMKFFWLFKNLLSIIISPRTDKGKIISLNILRCSPIERNSIGSKNIIATLIKLCSLLFFN